MYNLAGQPHRASNSNSCCVKVFWDGAKNRPEGQELLDTERMVREAAELRGYDIAGIRCGIHNFTREGSRCEQHITANFCHNKMPEDWYFWYEYDGVPAHIYTDGTKLLRVEFYGKAHGET